MPADIVTDPAGPLGFTQREWRTVLPLSFASFFENYDYAHYEVAIGDLRLDLQLAGNLSFTSTLRHSRRLFI